MNLTIGRVELSLIGWLGTGENLLKKTKFERKKYSFDLIKLVLKLIYEVQLFP